MRSFIPEHINCVSHTDYSHWTDAAKFIYDAITATDDILLINDEDSFIVNWKEVEAIANFIKEENIIFCGVPDSGVVTHRNFDWVTANPCFVFFNCKLIKDTIKLFPNFSFDNIGNFKYYQETMIKHKPDFIFGSCNTGNDEPFNGLFHFLAERGNPLYLNATTLGDGLTSEIKGLTNNVIVSLHTWMSRDKSLENVERINKIYEYAKSIKS